MHRETLPGIWFINLRKVVEQCLLHCVDRKINDLAVKGLIKKKSLCYKFLYAHSYR